MTPAIISLEDLAAALAPRSRLLGLDLGTKTIGLALSDVERSVASPLDTIRRTKFTKDVALLGEVATRYAVAALVVGWPLNMDGTEGPRTQATRSFLRLALPLVGVPAVLWDERLSTAAVTRSMIEQDVSRRKRAEAVDRLAAAYILEGALLRLGRIAAGPTRGGPDGADESSR